MAKSTQAEIQERKHIKHSYVKGMFQKRVLEAFRLQFVSTDLVGNTLTLGSRAKDDKEKCKMKAKRKNTKKAEATHKMGNEWNEIKLKKVCNCTLGK